MYHLNRTGTCIIFAALTILLMSLKIGAQETTKEQTTTTEEISQQQFFEEFFAAVQVNDVERIRQLVADYPNTVQKVQHRLTLLGKMSSAK